MDGSELNVVTVDEHANLQVLVHAPHNSTQSSLWLVYVSFDFFSRKAFAFCHVFDDANCHVCVSGFV